MPFSGLFPRGKRSGETSKSRKRDTKSNIKTSSSGGHGSAPRKVAPVQKSNEDRDKRLVSFHSEERQEIDDRPMKRQRSAPSEKALHLSKQLKDLSRGKKFEEALLLYRDPSNDAIRDGHHACIIIDCCARCGRIEQGEKIVEEMTKSGKHVNVETKTALIKGYAHSGQMAKADALFTSMCNSPGRADRPNVRTMNTLLRGCLWSACNVDNDGIITGGVVTAEKAWSLCQELQEKDSKSIFFDVSSYEYSISLLCQALRTNDAEARINEMKEFFKVSKTSCEISQSLSETLALSYLALARASAILGETERVRFACQLFAPFLKASRESLEKEKDLPSNNYRYAVKQGKDLKGSRRDESNTLYRNHRMNEAEREVSVLLELCDAQGLVQAQRQLARRLTTRLLVLSGGGSTDAEKIDQLHQQATSRTTQGRFLNTLYFSFGLKHVLTSMGISMKEETTFLKRKDCNRILASIGLQGGIVDENGMLDIQRIFRIGLGEVKKTTNKRPKSKCGLEIELGSGFGDWIVKKARSDPSTNFISVELRADRVWQTFARTAVLANTTPVDNLCIVGAESTSFLSEHIHEASVSAIYINHPEPPTQTYGADSYSLESIMSGGVEPAHMISSQMLRAAAKCLTKHQSSRLVIVTDNKWYGRLLCATLVKVMRAEENLLVPVKLDGSFEVLERFPIDSDSDSERQVALYEGQPNNAIGHPEMDGCGLEGATYFDRLWRTGAGTHADKSSRFIIVAGRIDLIT